MENLDTFIKKHDSILERNEEALANSKRQHHTDWDNHILTLSTASLGFTFTFLPLADSYCFIFAELGILAFILSICFATANYIFADKGFEMAFNSLALRRKHTLKLEKRFNIFKNELTTAQASNDAKACELAKEQCAADINVIYEETDLESDTEKQKGINKIIAFLNYAKTYAFISGILLVVIFTFNNIEMLGK